MQLYAQTLELKPLRPRQTKAIESVRMAIKEGHKRIVLQAPPGSGKCHGKGTEIIMYDGSLRKVEAIRVGDLLMGPDSQPRTIGSTVKGWGPLYRVTPIKGESFVCNDAHVLSLKSTRYWQMNGNRKGGKWRSAEMVNISVTDYLSRSKWFRHIHKLWRTAVMFPPRENCFAISPYVMGLWLGDGNSRKAAITTEDEEIAREFIRCGEEMGLHARIEHNTDNSINVHLSNGYTGGVAKNPFQEQLNRYGLVLNKHIPDDYLLSTRENRLELLAGLVDTDGHSRGNCIDVIQKSERLAREITFLARSLGLCATLSPCIKTCTNNGVAGKYFRVNISGETSVIPCRLERKRCALRTQKKNCLLTGFTVETIGDGEYYGFTLDGDHLYLLRDFTVTHNTIIASHVIAGALDKGKLPIFCVPRISLISQTIKRFEAQGLCDIGVIQGQHERTDFSAMVQIASIHTLVKRPLPEVDFAIIDEVHLQLKSLNKILDSEAWKDKIVIGLSATPWTKGMGLRWTKLIVLATTNEMIEEGWLTPVVGYGVPDDFMPDVSEVHTNFDGEYVEGEAEKAMTTQKIVGNVVKTWLEKWGKDKTFMFCVNRSHARKMQQEFEDAGVSCGYIDGTMDAEEREAVLRKYRSGEIKLIASIDTMGIGVDEDVRCIVYLRLTKSEIKWVQDGGRGIRIADGKESCLLLDHAGTAEGLGLFTDIHHEDLDTRNPEDKGQAVSGNAPKPKKCPNCNLLVSRSATVCSFCFTKLHKGKTPREVNAELVRIGAEKKQRLQRTDEQVFYSGLIDFAQRRGFKPGWAANKFKERFGVWPRNLNAVPMTPRKAVKEFIAESAKRWREQKKASVPA